MFASLTKNRSYKAIRAKILEGNSHPNRFSKHTLKYGPDVRWWRLVCGVAWLTVSYKNKQNYHKKPF